MESGGHTSISIFKDLHHELLGSRWLYGYDTVCMHLGLVVVVCCRFDQFNLRQGDTD